MKDFIPVNEPDLTGNEKKYLQECVDTGWISSEGPFVEKLEIGMAKLCNRKHAFAVCNGSAALELAVKAIGVGKGDEVIMPTFTIISCALAVIRSGAIPVYVDADPETWNMADDEIEAKLTERTKAIMAVHIYGLTVDMEPLLNLAEKYKLKVIEDDAEVIGQTYKDKPCGTFGDISTFSFYPNKHITTGEGGMVLVNDDELAHRCNSLRNLSFGKSDRFIHKEQGWNFRISNLQAAIGVAQLERLDQFIRKKREIGLLYGKHLEDCPHIQLPLVRTQAVENIFWIYGVVLNNESVGNAKEIMRKLSEKNIGTRPFFYPMHLQPALHDEHSRPKLSYPISENLAKMGFYLPSGLTLSQEEISFVSKQLKSILVH